MLGKADWEIQLEQIRAEADQMVKTVEKLEGDLSHIRVSRTSADGAVTVDLNSDGSVDRIALGHRACELGHTKLSTLINETMNAARREHARKHEALVDAAYRDKPQTREIFLAPVARFLVDEESVPAAPPVASGKWAAVEPEPEPERTRPRPVSRPAPRRPRGQADDQDYGTDRPW